MNNYFRSIFIIILFSIFTINILNAKDNRNEDFRLSFAAKYLSRFTAYGIDLASESAALGLSTSLSHNSGFYGDIYFTNPTDSDVDAQQTTVDVGYEREISDFFSVSAEYSQHFFSSDTVNILSSFSNSIAIGAELSFEFIDIGFSYDQFLGSESASYFSFDISTFQEVGPFYILPLYQAVFMSQTVDESFLLKGKKKKKENQTIFSTKEVSGLANSIITAAVIYPATDNLSVSFTPVLILSHNEDLSSESSQFIWNAGLRYRFSF